jgi:hypothetical protein
VFQQLLHLHFFGTLPWHDNQKELSIETCYPQMSTRFYFEGLRLKMREALEPLSAACFDAQSKRTAMFQHAETIPAIV